MAIAPSHPVHLTIKIGASGDPVLFPELTGKIKAEGELVSVGILEGGMQSGRASLAFNVRLANGDFIVVQTSAEQLRTVVAVLKGAEQRFAARARARSQGEASGPHAEPDVPFPPHN